MKPILQRYTAYHLWANKEIGKLLVKLTPEQVTTNLGGSFEHMRALVWHVWDSESIWYQRLQLEEKPIRPSEGFSGSFAEGCAAWLRQSALLAEWVASATPARIDHIVAFTRQKNEHYKMAVADIIMHVCNHSTFHRGQLVFMLRQLGITKIPSTDFSSFSRKK
ncbi:Uncharacterized damage-inducible protein DinB (forms a four-helix bundle) [Chitinophaga jiangningensis]|uniref:Uncharacterized damage-inducible protein DinB (Forms a four-helix bundle) n=1 Tax=Chitinophaga jiangningensis TaxID=1419482 RepID=A0A1M6W3X4_9BACT|nr:DinB family protein [Chitinophaga jiangningensis]SHK88399.1 Uncharacterized damage-inducible protein DinB (forms a four-helix bundle) [Chitinophaga jiangningensis]